MVEGLYFALGTIFTIEGILMLLLGAAVVGLIFGVIPGLGASQAMIVFLPVSYALDPLLAIIFFVAILATATFGGSISAILINTPGTPANIVTMYEGYPMALRGDGRKAIYISAVSCFVGTTLGSIALLASIPVLREIILAFGTTQTFWLIVFGLFMISVASRGNAIKGLAAGWIGVLISLIGRSYVFPGERFTAGIDYLYDGIPLAGLLVGLFAVSSAIFIGAKKMVSQSAVSELDTKIFSPQQFKEAAGYMLKYKGAAIRSTLIGVFSGIIPAVGGGIASFISYFFARQFSRNPEEYGKGSAEGLIAIETSSNAKDGGALMPTLAFGIPGDPNTAVLLGTLMMFGIPLGFRLFHHEVHILLLVVISLFLAQAIASIVGVSLGGSLAKLTTINTSYIVPIIIFFSFYGAYVFLGNIWDILIVLTAALLAFGLILLDYPHVGMIIGYFLGVDAERTFIMTLRMQDGSLAPFFTGYINWILISAIVLTLIGNHILNKRQQKQVQSKPEEELQEEVEESKEDRINRSRRDILSIIIISVLIIFTSTILIVSLGFEYRMSVFPISVSLLVLGLLIIVALSEFSTKFQKLIGTYSESKAPVKKEFGLMGIYIKTIFQVIAYAILVLFLGFFITPLFVLYFILDRSFDFWKAAVTLSVAIFVILMVMTMVPGFPMWIGGAPEIIPDFVGGARLPRFF